MDKEMFFERADRLRGRHPFNEGQRAAVGAPEGPMLIEAGPGSGKTTVLVWRVAYTLRVLNARPERVCVVTFTRAAAREMRERLQNIVRDGVFVRMGTIHSLARTLLTEAGSDPGDPLPEGKRLAAARRLLTEAGIPVTDDLPAQFLSEVDALRNRLSEPERHAPTRLLSGPLSRQETFVPLARTFLAHLRRGRQTDYDGWLERLHRMLTDGSAPLQHRFDHILIDEFQDTSLLQYEVLRRLVGPGRGLYAVGDQDQSIYGWRGAGPEVFRGFLSDYPDAGRVVLDVNYRATPTLITATNRLIAHNENREQKRIRAGRVDAAGSGREPVVIRPRHDVDEAGEIARRFARLKARGVPWREMAVVYRRNEQALTFISCFGREGMPVKILGNPPSPFDSWVADDVLAYLRLGAGQREPALLERIMYRPNRFISRADTRAAARLWRRGATLVQAFAAVDLNPSQRRRIADLESHLRRLGTLPPPDAVRFIREHIGYDEYLLQQSGDNDSDFSNFTAQALLLETAAAGFARLDDFIAFGMEVKRDSNEWWKRFLARTARAGAAPREEGREAVTLTTCHSAKGLEFDVVAVAGLVDDVLPGKTADLEEERRLAYVAMTRARRVLYLSAPRALLGEARAPSPFVKEATGVDLQFRDGAAGGAGTSVPPIPGTAVRPHPTLSSRSFAGTFRDGAARVAEAMAEIRRTKEQIAAEAERLAPGVRVGHVEYGVGRVIAVDGRAGTVTVLFDDLGEKIFVVEDSLRKGIIRRLS